MNTLTEQAVAAARADNKDTLMRKYARNPCDFPIPDRYVFIWDAGQRGKRVHISQQAAELDWEPLCGVSTPRKWCYPAELHERNAFWYLLCQKCAAVVRTGRVGGWTMPTQHTPGPWRVAEQRERGGTIGVWVHPHNGSMTGVLHAIRPLAERRANARLIAAAPDMEQELIQLKIQRDALLEACEALLDTLSPVATLDGFVHPASAAAIEQARAAIALTEGETR